jgi:hypothetical protein
MQASGGPDYTGLAVTEDSACAPSWVEDLTDCPQNLLDNEGDSPLK